MKLVHINQWGIFQMGEEFKRKVYKGYKDDIEMLTGTLIL